MSPAAAPTPAPIAAPWPASPPIAPPMAPTAAPRAPPRTAPPEAGGGGADATGGRDGSTPVWLVAQLWHSYWSWRKRSWLWPCLGYTNTSASPTPAAPIHAIAAATTAARTRIVISILQIRRRAPAAR